MIHGSSNTIKVATKVIVIEIALLNLLSHLSLTLARLLSILELEAMLVHWETHSL